MLMMNFFRWFIRYCLVIRRSLDTQYSQWFCGFLRPPPSIVIIAVTRLNDDDDECIRRERKEAPGHKVRKENKWIISSVFLHWLCKRQKNCSHHRHRHCNSVSLANSIKAAAVCAASCFALYPSSSQCKWNLCCCRRHRNCVKKDNTDTQADTHTTKQRKGKVQFAGGKGYCGSSNCCSVLLFS